MKTIFLVDDSATNLMAAKNALADVYKTYTLPSAEKMFSLLEKIKPDLILLDISMPEMDGYEALSILKTKENFKNIPVIFLTGKDDDESEKQGLEMGAVDYVKKPYSPSELIDCIEKHIKRN